MSAPSHTFDSVEATIQAIADGQLVIVTDDEDRENEGDLIMAACKATPQTVNMMIRYCSGIVCVPMLEASAAAFRARADGRGQPRVASHRFHRQRGCRSRDYDRD